MEIGRVDVQTLRHQATVARLNYYYVANAFESSKDECDRIAMTTDSYEFYEDLVQHSANYPLAAIHRPLRGFELIVSTQSRRRLESVRRDKSVSECECGLSWT
jgi:hypothetical protein